jgi:hypothetical protein
MGVVRRSPTPKPFGKMREDKARLERAAMLMFIRAMRLAYERDITIYEQRERPDFWVLDETGRRVGVEITHLYHNEEEARFLNGRALTDIHPITTTNELLDALNHSLLKKAPLSFKYEAPDGLILLIRVTSPQVKKAEILANLARVQLPPAAFDEVWMLFYDFDHLDWADLLLLGGNAVNGSG